MKPLGNPLPNSIKFFAAPDVLELTKDRSWLVKATMTINQHWQQKNARQRKRALEAESPQTDAPLRSVSLAANN